MQIIGHRGARGEAPENTLGGFQYLRDLGIRAVEFDVRQLQDDNLYIIHDDNFLRTSGQEQSVYQCPIEDFAKFNLCQGWDNWHQTEYLATLSQVMNSIRDFDHIEVEVKAVTTPANAEHLVSALEIILLPYRQQVTITSFDLKILQALKDRHSVFNRGLLVEIPIGEHAIDIAYQYHCNRIGWKDALVNQTLIELSQQANLKTSVWTVNDVERAKQLQDWNIDGLITDYPKLMLQHFKS